MPLRSGCAAPLQCLPGPRGLPLIGSLHRWEPARAHLMLEQWAQQYGPMYRLRIGPRMIVVVSEPDAVATVLRERPGTFRRHHALPAAFAAMGLEGVLAAEGEDWRRLRAPVALALGADRMGGCFAAVAAATSRLHARWLASAATRTPVDPCGDLARFGMDIACTLAFGPDRALHTPYGEVPLRDQLERIVTLASRRSEAPWPSWRWFRSRAERDLAEALGFACTAIQRQIAQERRRPASQPTLLQALLAGSGRGPADDRAVQANLLSMLLAGRDATAGTIAWALHLLSGAPAVARAARTEALEALQHEAAAAGQAPHDGRSRALEIGPVLRSHDSVRALPLIEAIVLEALRLKPAVPLGIFAACHDTDLGPVRLPQNTLVCVLTRPAATDPAHFALPNEFLPQRWLAGESAASGAGSVPTETGHRALLPFGGGPRACPGRYLALLECKMVLAMALAAFEFESLGAAVDEAGGCGMAAAVGPRGLRLRFEANRLHTARGAPTDH
jgi:cytochrome P450